MRIIHLISTTQQQTGEYDSIFLFLLLLTYRASQLPSTRINDDHLYTIFIDKKHNFLLLLIVFVIVCSIFSYISLLWVCLYLFSSNAYGNTHFQKLQILYFSLYCSLLVSIYVLLVLFYVYVYSFSNYVYAIFAYFKFHSFSIEPTIKNIPL